MEVKVTFICFLFLKLLMRGHCFDQQEGLIPKFGIKKLFVFGDSYADTGNVIQMFREKPYGITYPGKPAGRYSNGHILTDYLAQYLGVKSPVPYRWRRYQKRHLHNGMNFAFGGAGVFQTVNLRPNLSSQIHYFERLIKQYSLYTQRDLEDSLALVTLSGNDYSSYILNGGNIGEIFTKFIPKVVNELESCLRRISGLGIKRIAVGSVPPLGCLPVFTKLSGFQQCNSFVNLMSEHNVLLNGTLSKLNDEIIATEFAVINLQAAFNTILSNKGDPNENLELPTPLKPCCLPIGSFDCGDVDSNGTKMYTLCDKPESAFFWDKAHPTQAGWHAVFQLLKSAFQDIAEFGH
ncbi:OLC1v1028394C2 [Oldenlandia corymbosa var. corymbosa]|uniref:OLC1v1028394C2 n=1 Tax=Oldenlandia corymbosa var. corymbosa TaxID=529605 RepID=A0AAV1CBL6_OLDCO|nr:OLC1v1028394C2 [Oldenlandia corymbosa var. corymbosa]